jgi:hypothetical protein
MPSPSQASSTTGAGWKYASNEERRAARREQERRRKQESRKRRNESSQGSITNERLHRSASRPRLSSFETIAPTPDSTQTTPAPSGSEYQTESSLPSEDYSEGFSPVEDESDNGERAVVLFRSKPSTQYRIPSFLNTSTPLRHLRQASGTSLSIPLMVQD